MAKGAKKGKGKGKDKGKASDAEEPLADCGIPNKCTRVVPGSIVAIDNIPTVTMFILGAILVWWVWWPLSIPFLIYCGLSIVLFWALICPYCNHFNTKACPCGYGVIAPRYFKFRGSKHFAKVFRKNIAVMFPCWIVPTIAGIYLLWTHLTILVAGVFIAFCIVGFALIPTISRFVGCAGCEIKDQCPWWGGIV